MIIRAIASTSIVAISMIAGGCSSGPATPADDIATIMKWWDGDYHNDRQVAQLEADGKPVWRADDSGEGGHIEVTSHYRPVDLPAFGAHVIYVEETKHRDPTNMFRQRIYTLTVDEELGAVRVKLWNFKDKESYVGAWTELDRLDDLLPEEMGPLPDKCDLIVSRQDDKFHMPMSDKDCAFGESYFNYQVLLGEDSFSFRDKIVRLEDDVVTSTAGDFTYHELDRQESCSTDDLSVRCILGLAESALSSIDSDADRVLATAEVAQAYAANDRNADAVAILQAVRVRADAMEDNSAAASALAAIAHSFAAADAPQAALDTVAAGAARVATIDSDHKRQDLNAKLLSITAAAGDVTSALAGLDALPHDDDTLAAYKARGMMEVAVMQAGKGNFDGAEATIADMSIGLTYYRTKAAADTGRLALQAGDTSRGERLLGEALALAESIDNGYFAAGTLRDIGNAWDQGAGDADKASDLMQRAADAARTAESPQEQARAISRIATRMADAGRYDQAVAYIPESIAIARDEPDERMRNYSYYEIAGSAAFGGAFDTARTLLSDIPDGPIATTTSIVSAAQRDVAWGLARHDRLADAVATARKISAPRERVQAFSRIVRLLADPGMQALPRYL